MTGIKFIKIININIIKEEENYYLSLEGIIEKDTEMYKVTIPRIYLNELIITGKGFKKYSMIDASTHSIETQYSLSTEFITQKNDKNEYLFKIEKYK